MWPQQPLFFFFFFEAAEGWNYFTPTAAFGAPWSVLKKRWHKVSSAVSVGGSDIRNRWDWKNKGGGEGKSVNTLLRCDISPRGTETPTQTKRHCWCVWAAWGREKKEWRYFRDDLRLWNGRIKLFSAQHTYDQGPNVPAEVGILVKSSRWLTLVNVG